MSTDKTVPTTATVAPSTQFDTIIAAFAAKTGLAADAVKETLLKDAINDTSDDSVAILGSAHDLPNETWATMFPSVKKPVLNNAVNTLRVAVNPVAPAPAAPVVNPAIQGAAAAFGANGATMVQLEQVGDDAAFLSLLVTGGRLDGRISRTDAATIARVIMGQAIRIFDAPQVLADRIETTAENTQAPVDVASAFELIDSITAREYAPILRVLGAPVRAVNATQRKTFLDRVTRIFLPALSRFHGAVSGWYEGYKAERNDPSLLISAITGGLNGMAPMVVTDTSPIRSAAADFMDACNKTFAGLYAIPASRAMAADMVQILGQLNDPKYMLAAGFTTKEEMFRTLGVSVSEQFARSEKALETYIVNVIRIPDVADAVLPAFAQQLFLLGQSLDWATLGDPNATKVKGTTGRKQVVEDPAFAPFPAGGSNGRGAYTSR